MKKYLCLVSAVFAALCLASCGKNNTDGKAGGEIPKIIENAVYDSAADAAAYSDYFGIWEGASDAKGESLEVSSADGGMYLIIEKGNDLIASGCAQTVSEYGCIYFFNEQDGNAYRISGGTDEILIEGFGAFTLKESESAGDDFGNIAARWYLNGDENADYSVETEANGGWTLYERLGNINYGKDSGRLCRDPNSEEHYFAVSERFEGVRYDLYMLPEKNGFRWGEENDLYIRE